MGKHLIEDLKVGAFSQGPSGIVNVEMQLKDAEDNSLMFYGMSDVDGVAVYLKSAESLYDILMANDPDDKEGWDKVYAADLGEDIDEEDPVWRLLSYLLYADWDSVNELTPKCIGQYLEDLDIPVWDDEDDDEEYDAEDEDE